jgi:hypothetical protein
LAVIRFEKTASRLTAIFLPRCNTTYLLSGANIQTKNETMVICGYFLRLIKVISG